MKDKNHPRALLVLPSLRGGGAERMALLLARGLRERGFIVRIALFHPENAYTRLVPPDVTVEAFRIDGRPVGLSVGRLLAWLARAARESDVVIGGLEGWATTLSALAARWARKPSVAWAHIDLLHYAAGWNALERGIHREAYRLVGCTVCVSEGVRGSLLRFSGRSRETTHVIYNALDAIGSRDMAIRRPEHPPIVLAAGQLWCEQKGFDLLVRSHARLLQAGLEHRLVIAGEGRDRPLLEALCRQLGVSGSVSLPGFLPNIQALYQRASVFVVPSRFEGFSMVLLEAMAHGVPVIATDCPHGPREVLDGGRYGILVPPEDEQSLAHEIESVLRDPEKGKLAAAAARERAHHFAVDGFLDRWQRLLEGSIAKDL